MNALILVDIQNDFLPGGALAVPEGDEVIPVVNRVQKFFHLVVATQDFHPPGHKSFSVNNPGTNLFEVIPLNGIDQVMWPSHCVQGTMGAEFASALNQEKVVKIFHKGTDPSVDSYSGFFDNGKVHSTGMGEWLKAQGVKTVFVCGLATDYCVKATALHAIEFGFDTYLIEDACRGVNMHWDDSIRALQEMNRAGVKIIQSVDLDSQLV